MGGQAIQNLGISVLEESLHNEKIYTSYSSPDIVCAIKLKRLRRLMRVTPMGD
jgi:hypothetical protein